MSDNVLWQPVNGQVFDDGRLTLLEANGNSLHVLRRFSGPGNTDEEIWLTLPFNVRLCLAVPVGWSEALPTEPGDYRMGYYVDGDWYRCIATVNAGMYVRFSLFTGIFSTPEVCPVDSVTYRVRGPVWWIRLPDAPSKPAPPEFGA